jgi:hypothetical protein
MIEEAKMVGYRGNAESLHGWHVKVAVHVGLDLDG